MGWAKKRERTLWYFWLNQSVPFWGGRLYISVFKGFNALNFIYASQGNMRHECNNGCQVSHLFFVLFFSGTSPTINWVGLVKALLSNWSDLKSWIWLTIKSVASTGMRWQVYAVFVTCKFPNSFIMTRHHRSTLLSSLQEHTLFSFPHLQ